MVDIRRFSRISVDSKIFAFFLRQRRATSHREPHQEAQRTSVIDRIALIEVSR